MEQPVKILLMGICGYGSNYIKEVSEREIPGIKIEGICEVVPNAADLYPIIHEQNIPIYKTPEEFYQEHTADLAVISTPIHLHYAQIVTCLTHGSNVLTEKPVCTSVEGARKLEQLAEKTGKFISVGYQLNYSRDVLALKKDILDGRFGKPVYMKALHAMRRGDKYYARNGWAGRIEIKGCAVNDSPFNNACAHQFQIMTFLLGDQMERAAELAEVQAEPYKGNRSVENFDIITVQAKTVSGVPLWYGTAHAIEDKKLGPTAEYRFEKGTVYFGKDFGQGPVAEYIYIGDDGTRIDYGQIPKGERLQKFYDAIDAVRQGTHPVCTVQCAIPHLEAVEKIAKLPITVLPQDEVEDIREDDDTFHAVKGLHDRFITCFKTRCMLSQPDSNRGYPLHYGPQYPPADFQPGAAGEHGRCHSEPDWPERQPQIRQGRAHHAGRRVYLGDFLRFRELGHSRYPEGADLRL